MLYEKSDVVVMPIIMESNVFITLRELMKKLSYSILFSLYWSFTDEGSQLVNYDEV
jgi:hypothetical protein